MSRTNRIVALWKALQEGLILPTSQIYKFFHGAGHQTGNSKQTLNNQFINFSLIKERSVNLTYRFLHDRVQQAAYSLIPQLQKQITHLKIGQLLHSHAPIEEQEEKLFEIVNQLNIGKSLIVEQKGKTELAELNLKAGYKARFGTAHIAAFEYFTIGISLLTEDRWQNQYELTLALYEAALEAAYLSGNFEQMKYLAEIILANAKTLLDRVKVYEIQIQAAQAQAQPSEAIQIALLVLQQLGVCFPAQPSELDIVQALEETNSILGDRQPLDLINLPPMTDANKLAVMQILINVSSSAFIAAPLLLPFIVLEQVNSSVQYGNNSRSPNGYAYFGLLLCGAIGDIERGYQFGQLALNLTEKINAKEIKARAYVGVFCSVWHWKETLKSSLPFLHEGYQHALNYGDLESASICALTYIMHSWFEGKELSDLSQETAAFGTQLAQLKQEGVFNQMIIFQQAILNLLGDSSEEWQLTGKAFDSTKMLPAFQQTGDQTALFFFYASTLFLCYLFGKFDLAVAAAIASEKYLVGATGLYIVALFYTYDSLAHLAIYSQVSEEEQQYIWERVTKNQEKMKNWADRAPANYLHKLDLVTAEQHRVFGKKTEAIDLYDRTIALAKDNGYLNEEAIANELAANFYLDWSKEKVAAGYMQEAYYCYARWGALAKTKDLEKRYPQLLKPILQQKQVHFDSFKTITGRTINSSTQKSSSSSSEICAALDFASILKASQALSSEIELEKLLSTLMQVAIENAGAKKAALLMLQKDTLLLEAIATNEGVNLPSIPCETSIDLPLSIINTVKRNRKTVVLHDATTQPDFIADAYLIQHQPKSVMCAPILNQGKLIGLLYLENKLTIGVFTPERLEVVQLLCSQAAISLQNARLYQESQIYARQLEQSLEKLRISEARFQKLADNVPGLIYQIQIKSDGSAAMLYVSSGCQALYEITAEEMLSDKFSLRDFEHPDDVSEIFQAFVESAQNLTPFRHEWRIVTPSGTVKWVKAAYQPERWEDGEMVWDGILIDITDLKRAEQEREQAMQELQQAQVQIVQSEKMSALGNLIAGVAHEMNNPLGFIAATLDQTKPTLADISEHLKLYQENLPNPSTEILEHAEEIDLDYSLEDLPKMIEAMVMACDTLKNISTSLRTFSRADRDYKVPFNIHDGINSTILILKHRLKANDLRPAIEVVTEYGDLPPVDCFPGQLNQVFMNILANAIDALDETNLGKSYAEIQANPNKIKIITSVENQQAQVIIADNGKGIKEEVKQKIFDQFFTTKIVGKGTGLGLAIAKQIVEKTHSGQLSCNSALNKGTEFIITIPIKSLPLG